MYAHLPPLQHLVAFEAAVRLGSFRAAAVELQVTPSAISQRIRALEAAIGFALFERGNREVATTARGQRYWDTVSEVLATLDRDTYRLQQQARRPILRVTTEAFLANEYLVPNMAAFREHAPGVDLRVETSMALVDLTREPIDAAVRWSSASPRAPGLHCVALRAQELALVCAPELAARIALPDGLARAPMVCIEDRYDAVRAAIEAAMGIELRPESVLLVDTFYSMVRAAARGQGVAFAFRPMVDPWLREGRLVTLPGMDSPFASALYFICAQRDAGRQEMRALLAWLQTLL